MRRAGVFLLLVAACSTSPASPTPHRSATPSPTASSTPTPTPATSPTEPTLSVVELGTFSSPVWVGPAPGDASHLYLAEKTGRVLQLDSDGKVEGVVLDVRDRISKTGEQGLLSIAFDPAYATNHRMYAFLCDKDKTNRVVAYTVANGVAGSPQELLAVDRPYPNHNGGLVLFDPTGMLLVGIGDGGSAGDPDNRAQDLASPHGKILRINPRTGAGAQGNPFPQHPKVWALGLRNPWRFSFDRNGDFYLGDQGQTQVEELDVLPPARQSGANYGWSAFEGDRFNRKEPVTGDGFTIVPALTYPHTEGSCSITAGEIYRGRAIPFLRGSFLFGDYCDGELMATDRTNSGLTPAQPLLVKVEGLEAFGHDTSGELLVLSTDKLLRVVTP